LKNKYGAYSGSYLFERIINARALRNSAVADAVQDIRCLRSAGAELGIVQPRLK
jgi:hypothetical protein